MTIVDTDVTGTLLARSQLSGMPGCKLAYTADNIDTVVYHPCVRVDKFEKGVVKFVPPDGQTELGRYRVTKHVKLPFRVLPVIRQLDENRIEVKVNIKAAFSKDVTVSAGNSKFLQPIHFLSSFLSREQIVSCSTKFIYYLFICCVDVQASDMILRIPCPRNTVSFTSKASKGTVAYYNELECLMWKWVFFFLLFLQILDSALGDANI
jgi:hypothetical protein